MTTHKTRPELLAALARAATKHLSADELHRQRVSFAVNAVSSKDVTRAEIERLVLEQEGHPNS